MCLYNLFYSIQLSLPTMPNNSLALTCCSSQLQNLVSLGCHQTKSQSSIIAQQSDSFGCNKWRYSTQPYGYTTTHTLGARKGKTGKLVKVSRGGVLNFKPENTSTKVNGYNFKTLFGNSFVILRLTSKVPR